MSYIQNFLMKNHLQGKKYHVQMTGIHFETRHIKDCLLQKSRQYTVNQTSISKLFYINCL